jgi:hypothetical protein
MASPTFLCGFFPGGGGIVVYSSLYVVFLERIYILEPKLCLLFACTPSIHDYEYIKFLPNYCTEASYRIALYNILLFFYVFLRAAFDKFVTRTYLCLNKKAFYLWWHHGWERYLHIFDWSHRPAYLDPDLLNSVSRLPLESIHISGKCIMNEGAEKCI